MATSDTPETLRATIARSANLVGYAGALPFAVLALWLFGIAEDHPWRHDTMRLLIGYAAVVLSFQGGTRWGLAMAAREPPPASTMGLGAVPPLLGWAALFVPAPYCFALLAVVFAALGAWDSFSVGEGGVPAWFGRLRMRLTVVAVAAMLLAFVATA